MLFGAVMHSRCICFVKVYRVDLLMKHSWHPLWQKVQIFEFGPDDADN